MSTSPSFRDGVELARLLAKSTDVQRCFAQKWIEYALGPQMTDQSPTVVTAGLGSGLNIGALIRAVAFLVAKEGP
jgi:hypothetical protein